MNAQILGLGSFGIGLCSPLLADPRIIITDQYPGKSLLDPVAIYGYPNTDLDPYFTYAPGPKAAASFPYGYEVEPDVPV